VLIIEVVHHHIPAVAIQAIGPSVVSLRERK